MSHRECGRVEGEQSSKRPSNVRAPSPLRRSVRISGKRTIISRVELR